METTVRYIKLNGTVGYIRTPKTGKPLAHVIRSIESKGSSVVSVKIPSRPEMTGNQIIEYVINSLKSGRS